MKTTAVVCTYNGEKYILKQLDSILNQSLKVNEIIICDDHSTDRTVEIITKIAQAHPDIIKVYLNPTNLQVNKNFEKAISFSTGDYIFFSDQDDIWELHKVAQILKVFQENPTAEGVFSNAFLIDERGDKRNASCLWQNVLFMEKEIKSEKELYSYISNIRNMVTGATLCIKKEVKKLICPFPDVKEIFHDEWIALILANKNALFYTKEKLISYRIHNNQQIGVIKPLVLKKNREIISSILNKTYPNDFNKLYLIYKSFFRNYFKFTSLKKSYQHEINFNLDIIIQTNKKNILFIESRLKKSNILLYYLKIIASRIAGKRQIN